MTQTSPSIPDTFIRFPPGAGPANLLEQAIGYDGQARFWATYWGSGDEAYYVDGNVEATGEWMGFQTFTEHPLVAAFLVAHHADLGSAETRARHLLLVDRETRHLYLARFREGKQFLHEQWGPLPVLTHEELLEHAQRIKAQIEAQIEAWDRQSPEARHREVMQRIADRQEACQGLQTWLTQQQTHQFNELQ